MEEVTNFQITDDERITLPYIYAKIAVIRDEMIDAMIRKGRRLDPMFYTKCNCVPVKCRNITCTDVSGEEMDSGVVEVYAEVGFLQNYLGRYMTTYVGGPDMCSPFRRLNFPHGVNGFHTRTVPVYYPVDNTLIFKNVPNELGVVTIVGITKNGTCLEDPCGVEDEPYNIPQNLIYELEKKAVYIIRNAAGVKRDIKNDTKDEQ